MCPRKKGSITWPNGHFMVQLTHTNVSTTIMWREKQPYPVVKICRRDHPRWVTAHKNNHKMSDTTKNKHKVTDTQFSVKT